MEQKQKLQRKRLHDRKRGEVKLDHRYGKIGISAVAAAVQCHSERHEEPIASSIGPQQRTQEARNMTSNRESKSEHQKKFNLGQRQAAQEKEKDAELRHMGELSKKKAGQEQTGKKR